MPLQRRLLLMIDLNKGMNLDVTSVDMIPIYRILHAEYQWI
jgi:hypothetical protein